MNTLVFGHSNSFKTERIMIKLINEKINNNESFIFLDPKEEYYNNYYSELMEKGYKINIINLRKSSNSNSWNPLTLPYKLYNSDKDKCVELLKNIGYSIFYDETVNDFFWINASMDLFVGLCLILFQNAKEEAINLFSVNNMLKQEEVFDKLLNMFDETSSVSLSLSEVLLAPKETRDSVFTVFRQKLNTYLLYENLSILLSYTDYDLRSIKDDKVALFIVNKDENKAINDLVNIYLYQVYDIVNSNSLNNNFNFVLDNIETVNNIHYLNDMLSISNSRGYDVLISARDMEWYKKNYDLININTIYNLDMNDSIIKVEKGIEKRKYKKDDYPVITLNKGARYPKLEKHPKFLFNLKAYLNSK